MQRDNMYPTEIDKLWWLATGKLPLPWFSLSLKTWGDLKFHLKMHRMWSGQSAVRHGER